MRLLSKLILPAVVGAALVAAGPALAQQKLKWAHVYETSEPYHTESVWAAAEIKKRTNGKFDIEVFPGELARQGNGHQPGAGARHGRHDHQRPVVRGAQLPAPRHRLLPVHLPRRRSPARLLEEPGVRRDGRGIPEEDRHPDPRLHVLRRAADDGAEAVHRLRRHEGPQDPCARRARLHGDAEGLRRESDADRVRRGLPRAAERHGRRAGEPADDDRGEEVLRGAEGDHDDLAHRRRPHHAGRPARVEQAHRPGKADLHRSRRAKPRPARRRRSRSARPSSSTSSRRRACRSSRSTARASSTPC